MTTETSNQITVAGIQFDPKIGLVRENRVRILSLIDEVAGQGAKLVVFPSAHFRAMSLMPRRGADGERTRARILRPMLSQRYVRN